MYLDIYTILSKRTAQDVIQFLDSYLPQRESREAYDNFSDCFELEHVLSIEESFDWLESNRNCSHTFYFSNMAEGDAKVGIVSWNDDGSLVVGVAVEYECLDEWSERLHSFSGNDVYWGPEVPPSASKHEFKMSCGRKKGK